MPRSEIRSLKQPRDQRPVPAGDAALRKRQDKLAATGFEAMILRPVVKVAVLFVVGRPAPRTIFS